MKLPESVEEIVRLANARCISTLPEMAWKARTGTNPVVTALQYAAVFGEKKKSIRVFLLGLFLFVFSAVLFSVLLLTGSPLALESRILVVFSFFSSLLMGASGVGCIAWAFLRRFDESQKLPDKNEIDLFWSDYLNFCRWANVLSPYDMPVDSEELRRLAMEILVKVTIPLLPFPPPQELPSPQSYARYRLLEQTLNATFDTLSRLGLTLGGTGTYYKEARRREEEMNQRMQKEARQEAEAAQSKASYTPRDNCC